MSDSPKQILRFTGGPLDAAEIRLDADFQAPDEILFRSPVYRPHTEAVYRLDIAKLLAITVEMLQQPVTTYRHVSVSEVFRLIHGQARQIVCLEDTVRQREKTIKRLQEQLNRSNGARKAAATRKRKVGA